MRNDLDKTQGLPNNNSGHSCDNSSWTSDEFKQSSLPDKRLHKRLIHMIKNMADHPMNAFPETFEDRSETEAAYRFIENDDVDVQKILDSHRQSTIQRAKSYERVLVPQDTTSFNYSKHPRTQGLGPIGDSIDGSQGIFLHHAFAISVQGEPLRIIHAKFWERDPNDFHKSRKNPKLMMQEKESIKWLDAWRGTQEMARQLPGTQIISVCDREADIYEILEAAATTKTPNLGLLVRAKYNRKAVDSSQPATEVTEEDRQLERYFDRLSNTSLSATIKVQVPRHE